MLNAAFYIFIYACWSWYATLLSKTLFSVAYRNIACIDPDLGRVAPIIWWEYFSLRA